MWILKMTVGWSEGEFIYWWWGDQFSCCWWATLPRRRLVDRWWRYCAMGPSLAWLIFGVIGPRDHFKYWYGRRCRGDSQLFDAPVTLCAAKLRRWLGWIFFDDDELDILADDQFRYWWRAVLRRRSVDWCSGGGAARRRVVDDSIGMLSDWSGWSINFLWWTAIPRQRTLDRCSGGVAVRRTPSMIRLVFWMMMISVVGSVDRMVFR